MRKDWERFYKQRGRFYLSPHPDFGRVINKLNTYNVSKVLDMGCGSGRHSVELARLGFDVVGADFSKEALNLGKKWAERDDLEIEFKLCDFGKKLPFKEGSFDAVIAIDSLCYDSRELIQKALKEAKRVLKKGGIIFLSFPTEAKNPLMIHLFLGGEEIEKLVEEYFDITSKFLDKEKYLNVFGIKR